MKNIILEKINELGNDAYSNEYDNIISVDFNDFEGFDEDWNEVMRDYDNPELVQDFVDFLKSTCDRMEGDFYQCYHYNDFVVQVGFTSYDI